MATTKSNRVAEYKGRKYRLLWSGKTKYGQRAHLEFFDGSKDFWVDASKVTEVASYRSGYVTERGHHEGYCGYPCPVTGKKCCPANGPCHDCV